MYFNLLNAVSYLERPDGVIAIPGLDTYAARPDHGQALARIHRITRRQEPFLLLGCDQAALEPYWAALPESGQRLMRKHWPGALVLALDTRSDLPEPLTSGQAQMKFMLPECGLLQALLAMLPDGALAVSGANRLESPVACTAADVYNSFGEDVDYVLPGDDLVREAPSPTVVSVDSGGEIHLLRSGGIVLD